MAAKIRVKIRREGIRELLVSKEAQEIVRERAQRVADAAGEGIEVLPMQEPRVRARALVGPVTSEAAARAAKENSLIRALEAGRG